ncbi:hypothetical protein FQN57_002408 [Myotisia sp. PD_48]|nr:hypothetical protein FQN57_002408 [Myotisia sp. PD_48]
MGDHREHKEEIYSLQTPDTYSTVIVIGAGSTGLAIAQGFKKAGISCIVFEKHESLDAQTRDWNMGLHWGTPALKALLDDDIWGQIESVHVDPGTPVAENDTLRFINARTGGPMTGIPVSKFYRLRRGKLRALLKAGVDIRYSKALKHIAFSNDENQPTTVQFADGSSASARFIIAADGARSTTRQILLGNPLGNIRCLPYVATFVQATYTPEQARYLCSFHPLYLAGIHPSGFFSFFGMHHAEEPDKPETWVFFFYISWKSSIEEQEKTAGWTSKQRMRQLKGMAKDFCDPWKSAFEWVRDDQPVWHMGLTSFDPGVESNHWDNHQGRVTLAGDAAHAMTYQRGQGLNHSVTDARNIVATIRDVIAGKGSQADAIVGYEEEMIVRAGEEVRLSNLNTEMLHDWERVLASPVLTSGMKPTN